MDATTQQSLAHVRPAGVQLTNAELERDLYRSIVLQLNETEEQIDQRVVQQALQLGIRIPHDLQTPLDAVRDDLNSLSLGTSPLDIPQPSHSQPSAPEAISTPSDSSVESKPYPRSPSLTTSIPSVDSAISASSDFSRQSKSKRGFQRFAAFRNRKKKAAAKTISTPTSPSRRSSSIFPSDSRSRADALDEVPRLSLKRSESVDSTTSYSGAYSSWLPFHSMLPFKSCLFPALDSNS